MSETPSCFIERAFQSNKTAIFLSNSAKHFFRLDKTREKTLKQTERLSLLFLPNRYSRSQNLIECPVFTELFYLGRRKRHSIFCVWRAKKSDYQFVESLCFKKFLFLLSDTIGGGCENIE